MKTTAAGSYRFATGLALAALGAAVLAAGCGRAPLPTAGGPRDLGPLTATAFKGGKPAVVGVGYRSRRELAKMVEAGLEVWYVDQVGRKAYGQIGASELSALRALGVEPRLVQAPGIFNDFDPEYHTYDEIKAELSQLASRNAEIAALVDIGDSWEKVKGKADRDILALRIGRGDTSKKPAVLFCGNHHAREIVTPEIVLKIGTMLLEGYGKDPDVTAWVENREIWLIPMVNPDGHRLASEGNDWRKNTNLTNGGNDFEAGPSGPGVDLNRNYGFKWGLPGASSVPSSPTYRGAGPFSEPETQALKALVEKRKWAFLMTYHSFSNLILWPWGHTDAPPPDKRLPAVGMKLGKLSGYKPQQSVQLYPTSGDTTDWAFGEHGILAYTTEIGSWGDGFDPPYAKLPTFWKQNEPGARLLLQLADNPNHVFGPELMSVTTRAGQVQVGAPAEAVEVEAFIDRAGEDGTGMKAPVNGGVAVLPVPPARNRGLVLVHARNAQGVWGPLKAAFR